MSERLWLMKGIKCCLLSLIYFICPHMVYPTTCQKALGLILNTRHSRARTYGLPFIHCKLPWVKRLKTYSSSTEITIPYLIPFCHRSYFHLHLFSANRKTFSCPIILSWVVILSKKAKKRNPTPKIWFLVLGFIWCVMPGTRAQTLSWDWTVRDVFGPVQFHAY